MKYYEFGNELDYYALIRAESPYVAAAKYIESVGYDAYDFGLVLEDTCEIAENSAFDKVVSAVVRNATNRVTLEGFSTDALKHALLDTIIIDWHRINAEVIDIWEGKDDILLIDGSLI